MLAPLSSSPPLRTSGQISLMLVLHDGARQLSTDGVIDMGRLKPVPYIQLGSRHVSGERDVRAWIYGYENIGDCRLVDLPSTLEIS